MSFDPFNDFETRGYLRNIAAEKDPENVKRLEHRAFLAKLDWAFGALADKERLSYQDVLDTHRALFSAVYPWAGQDRAQTAPDIAVSKGGVLFAHPGDARQAVELALRIGHDKSLMARKSGEVMGYLAYGHPFLDGNGRVIMLIHAELAQRARFSIDWIATDKADYLGALTRELEHPGKGHLDSYLNSFVRPAVGLDRLASHIAGMRGLDGNPDQSLASNAIVGRFSDPAVRTRYKLQEQQRGPRDE